MPREWPIVIVGRRLAQRKRLAENKKTACRRKHSVCRPESGAKSSFVAKLLPKSEPRFVPEATRTICNSCIGSRGSTLAATATLAKRVRYCCSLAYASRAALKQWPVTIATLALAAEICAPARWPAERRLEYLSPIACSHSVSSIPPPALVSPSRSRRRRLHPVAFRLQRLSTRHNGRRFGEARILPLGALGQQPIDGHLSAHPEPR